MNKKKYPKISIASLVQRAQDLVVVCERDSSELKIVKLPWDHVERLAILVKECANADALLHLKKENNVLATKRHKSFLNECKTLRIKLADEINSTFKLAGINVQLPGFCQNKSQETLVQDLNDFATISSANKETFLKYSFNFNLSSEAACKSKELADAIAILHIERECISFKELAHRNNLYKELYTLIKEVCLHGRKAFANDPTRRKFYHTIK